jgi:DNA-binding phage protein
MCDKYPRWDISEFLNTEEKACLYLKAALDDDTGNGDTIRLAWKDIQRAHEAGRVSINVFMDAEILAHTLAKYGLCESAIRKIASASICSC